MKIVNKLFLILFAISLFGCAEDDDLKGTLTISITDSPMDADNVKSVNIVVTGIDGKSGNSWLPLKRYDQPVGVSLTDYSGGNSFALVDQYNNPGKFSALRFNLNLADLNSSLIGSPQCNVVFTDGTSKPLYYYESGTPDVVATQEISISAMSHADFTFDFDVRKSLTIDAQGNYIFKPVIRSIETTMAGNIRATVMNYVATDRLVVFAYASGQFSPSETAAPAAGEVRFPNDITSCKISNNQFGLGFLPAGSYDLVFAKHDPSGEFLSVLGRFDNTTVVAGDTVRLNIDLTKLSGS